MTNLSIEMHTMVQCEFTRPLCNDFVMMSPRYINKFNRLTPLTSAGYKVSLALSKASCGAKYGAKYRGLRFLLARNPEQTEGDFSILPEHYR